LNNSNINQDNRVNEKVFSVSELNRLVKDILHTNFSLVWIKGEISGFSSYSSGHWYFKLKDKEAQVDCVMFSGKNHKVKWQPQNGDLVEVQCQVSIYEANGKYQLIIDSLQKAGLGELFEKYLQLKNKLAQDGLFEDAVKKNIPSIPKMIGVITSPDGAVLKDVITTLLRRNKTVSIIIYPSLVQGESAPEGISNAIKIANTRKEVDSLIVCRGGGSIEDLWSFNTEIVANAIFESDIPIISAVGHETDFTIADFVADLRAATPTAAAELISEGLQEIKETINFYSDKITRLLEDKINQAIIKIDFLEKRLVSPSQKIKNQKESLLSFNRRMDLNINTSLAIYEQKINYLKIQLLSPNVKIQDYFEKIQNLSKRFTINMHTQIKTYESKMEFLEQNLYILNPKTVLARGYSIVTTNDKKILNDSKNINVDDNIDITFHNGHARARITNKNSKS
jgi:exodeoxyribonuclease VII large subunit